MSYGSVRSSFSARRAFIQTLDADILWNNAGYGESGPVSEIATEIVERELPDPPYRRVMLKDFDALPASVRHLHKPLRDAAANGGAVVTGASSFAGRLIAADALSAAGTAPSSRKLLRARGR
ncbi:hypothetical protein [Sphingomonas sp. LHG3443-2]|uniref:hypothetical protein n=1 Tax=Sphingomonas sp. LHG3443-2 TaxID=2804639 RepID=UPI003CEADCDA